MLTESEESVEQLHAMNIKDILKVLPHRYPFLLVDKIITLDLVENTILGQKNLTINEAFFQGHFPDAPIMPGVLILEALAQAGGVLVHLKADTDKIAVLLAIDNAKFRHPARPGDVLFLEAKGIHFSRKGGKVHVRAYIIDSKTNEAKTVVQAEITFALVDKSQI